MANASPYPLLESRRGGPLNGRVRAPGDKSISHRSMILGALARGETTVEGLLESDDVLRTAQAMSAFGAEVEHAGPGRWRILSLGGLNEPGDVVDCGNAGTGVRLVMGAAAGFPVTATFTGDSSLRRRPMGRVLDPLGRMGAQWFARSGGFLPLTLKGGALKFISYTLPVPSAQVKSAVLLAGLQAEGGVEVIEPERTRDHTERMLRAFGVEVGASFGPEGQSIQIAPGQQLTAAHVRVPGDPSSAAFPLVAGLITPGSRVVVEGVLLNALRTGLFDTLRDMGADLTIEHEREESGELVGDVVARHSALKGVTVPPGRAPSMIDEYPILAVAAAFADGETVMHGVGELRVKESDRAAAMAAGLDACGVDVEEEPETLIVRGTGKAPRGGAMIETHHDHRVAMSHLMLGLASEEAVAVDHPGMIATSFPGFVDLMTSLGAEIAGR